MNKNIIKKTINKRTYFVVSCHLCQKPASTYRKKTNEYLCPKHLDALRRKEKEEKATVDFFLRPKNLCTGIDRKNTNETWDQNEVGFSPFDATDCSVKTPAKIDF